MASYQYGKIDSLSLLDLYRSYKETKREYLRTLFNYRIALAELQVAAEEEE
jgi:outer membrane protein TolC